jgi:glycerol kinase
MMIEKYLLGIDQGTTSSRAVIFDANGAPLKIAQQEFPQYYPQDGWVEHNPEEIWQVTLAMCRQVIAQADIVAAQIAAIGISNQRETTLIWDRNTGIPIYNAIVWQDRRTAEYCQQLLTDELQQTLQHKTGLLLDPYFSATKIKWILDNVAGARVKAERGELCFGTIDTFLLWRLTQGKSYKTDATNAARTLLFNIRTQTWDVELLTLFSIPASILPEVCDSSHEFGMTDKELFGSTIPIAGIAGDQQAALIGQTCFEPGMLKSTYGTGCFMMMNTGTKMIMSQHRLLTTVAYRLQNITYYAMEGSIFIAGATIQWLRDALHLIANAKETETLVQTANPNSRVYMVPAFTGLGAPYWDPHARAAIFGLTRDSGIAELVRAALEAVAYQTKDLLQAMLADTQQNNTILRVDGGMVRNDWLVQFLADILNLPVERPSVTETSVLGAVYLAGLQVGIFHSLEHISQLWHCQQHFTPTMSEEERGHRYSGWSHAVQKVIS